MPWLTIHTNGITRFYFRKAKISAQVQLMHFFTQEVTDQLTLLYQIARFFNCRSQDHPVWSDVMAPRTISDYKCIVKCQGPDGDDHRLGRTPLRALTLSTSTDWASRPV